MLDSNDPEVLELPITDYAIYLHDDSIVIDKKRFLIILEAFTLAYLAKNDFLDYDSNSMIFVLKQFLAINKPATAFNIIDDDDKSPIPSSCPYPLNILC